MEWALLAKFGKAYWSQLALGLVILGMSITLGVTRHTLSVRTQSLHNTEQAYSNFQKEVKNKTEAAEVADQKHALAVHQADEAVRINHEQTLQNQLDAARRAAADYARMRIQASGDTRRIGPSSISPTTNPSGPATGTSESSVVDEADLQACAENTVKAQAWQDWWNDIQKVPDRE